MYALLNLPKLRYILNKNHDLYSGIQKCSYQYDVTNNNGNNRMYHECTRQPPRLDWIKKRKKIMIQILKTLFHSSLLEQQQAITPAAKCFQQNYHRKSQWIYFASVAKYFWENRFIWWLLLLGNRFQHFVSGASITTEKWKTAKLSLLRSIRLARRCFGFSFAAHFPCDGRCLIAIAVPNCSTLFNLKCIQERSNDNAQTREH